MKKAIIFVVAITLVAVLLIMNPNEKTGNEHEVVIEEINKQPCEIRDEYYGDYSLITVPPEMSIGNYFVTKEHIYFFDNQVIPMGNYATSCFLREYSISDRKIITIYEIERESNIYVNEMVYADGYLGWQVMYEDGRRDVEIMELETLELSVIHSAHADDLIGICYALGGSGNHITWYEGRQSGDTEEWQYVIYSISEGTTEIIEDVTVTSPYFNPNIRGGNIVTLHNEGDHFSLRKRNLLTSEILTVHLPTEIKKIQNICANDSYIVWHTDYKESNLYVYDIEKQILNRLSIVPYIFSIDLVNNTMVINDREDFGLIAIDLVSYQVRQIGDAELTTVNFTMNEVFEDIYMAIYRKNDLQGLPTIRGIFYLHID